MADGADAHDAVPCFKMTPGVPGDGRDTVAELDAMTVELLPDLQRAGADIGVVGAVDRPLDRSRHDFLVAVNGCRMIDDPMTQQGPILHQSKHPYLLLKAVLLFGDCAPRRDLNEL